MPRHTSIFWFRQDLRLADNPGLSAAVRDGTVLPIYILDTEACDKWQLGGASKWWLHHSLQALNKSLDGKLNFYRGSAREVIPKLIQLHNIKAVYWNRCYEPSRIKDDTSIKECIKALGIECASFDASLLWEPWEVSTNSGTPYKVFTPFYRNGCAHAAPPRIPLPKPPNLALAVDENALTLAELDLIPKIEWYTNIATTWKVGEDAAQNQLSTFLENRLLGYKEGRNYPDKRNVSRLSPYLHFGEISPHQVWHSAQSYGTIHSYITDMDCFLSEIAWREFSYYLLYHFPELPQNNFQEKFANFPWRDDYDLLHAWQRGQTGYPIVDAGMRELWQTGYMHNRVRMIVGSFLVKNLLIHWHHGARWFWDCLVDADLANNSASWQWVAGCGADAAPYFRIFNPILQGEKFDPTGEYTHRFVPELKNMPNKYLFAPWTAPQKILQDAGVVLGSTYPKPIVDAAESRNSAMQAYLEQKNNT